MKVVDQKPIIFGWHFSCISRFSPGTPPPPSISAGRIQRVFPPLFRLFPSLIVYKYCCPDGGRFHFPTALCRLAERSLYRRETSPLCRNTSPGDGPLGFTVLCTVGPWTLPFADSFAVCLKGIRARNSPNDATVPHPSASQAFCSGCLQAERTQQSPRPSETVLKDVFPGCAAGR